MVPSVNKASSKKIYQKNSEPIGSNSFSRCELPWKDHMRDFGACETSS